MTFSPQHFCCIFSVFSFFFKRSPTNNIIQRWKGRPWRFNATFLQWKKQASLSGLQHCWICIVSTCNQESNFFCVYVRFLIWPCAHLSVQLACQPVCNDFKRSASRNWKKNPYCVLYCDCLVGINDSMPQIAIAFKLIVQYGVICFSLNLQTRTNIVFLMNSPIFTTRLLVSVFFLFHCVAFTVKHSEVQDGRCGISTKHEYDAPVGPPPTVVYVHQYLYVHQELSRKHPCQFRPSKTLGTH